MILQRYERNEGRTLSIRIILLRSANQFLIERKTDSQVINFFLQNRPPFSNDTCGNGDYFFLLAVDIESRYRNLRE